MKRCLRDFAHFAKHSYVSAVPGMKTLEFRYDQVMGFG